MKRPEIIEGKTVKVDTGCGKMYITVNADSDIVEVFCRLGKSGGCASAQTEAIGRLLNWGCKAGAKIDDAVGTLRGITCSASDGTTTNACPHSIAMAIESIINNTKTIKQ